MASAISKRQQARNERQLQELIRSVPGNDRCADCGAKNPGWASWNLGVFLCMRCAALHRKMGTHVSKVKSLSMDSWSPEQVENLKKIGNVKSNAIWNPRGVRPDIPVDADEAEAAMEKFIRQKYEHRTLSTGAAVSPAVRQNTGSTGTGSWNDEPPPLPPKPAKKFGFNLRSASSTFHRSKPDHFTPPLSPTFSGSDRSASERQPPSPQKSKPSQVFGMKITSVNNNFDTKLATLRDMGFSDSRRNSDVLKSMNGSVDRAVEALVRMGEGSSPAPERRTLGPRTLTPVSMGGPGVNGISIEKTRQPEKKVSNNPWEISEQQPQRAATQPASIPPRTQSAEPASASWNPFLNQQQQSQPQQGLENTFQNMQISQTGTAPQQFQSNPFPPAMQQSNPWQPQQSQSYTTDSLPQPQFQRQPSAAPQFDQASNPFLRQTQSQTFTPSNPWMAQSLQTSQSPPPNAYQPYPWAPQAPTAQSPIHQQSVDPFAQSLQPQAFLQQPTTVSPASMAGQQEYFAQQNPQAPVQPVQQQPTQQFQFFNNAAPNQWQQFSQLPQQPQQTGVPSMSPFQQQQQHVQQPMHQFPPSQPTRHDKASILSLYNMPPLAPRQPLQTLQEDPNATPQTEMQPPQRSVTMPIQQMAMGSMNPFGAAVPMQPRGPRHVSNESVDFQGMGGGGRHSPDAFSGLSARYMR